MYHHVFRSCIEHMICHKVCSTKICRWVVPTWFAVLCPQAHAIQLEPKSPLPYHLPMPYLAFVLDLEIVE
jgi:hypothetical protein